MQKKECKNSVKIFLAKPKEGPYTKINQGNSRAFQSVPRRDRPPCVPVTSRRDNKERRTAAEAQAKQMIADAQRNGLALLKQTQEAAEAREKALLRQAEERAAVRREAIAGEARAEAEDLRRRAEANLDAAAELIVRRVVRD